MRFDDKAAADARFALFRLAELLAELPLHLRAAGLADAAANQLALDAASLNAQLRALREGASEGQPMLALPVGREFVRCQRL